MLTWGEPPLLLATATLPQAGSLPPSPPRPFPSTIKSRPCQSSRRGHESLSAASGSPDPALPPACWRQGHFARDWLLPSHRLPDVPEGFGARPRSNFSLLPPRRLYPGRRHPRLPPCRGCPLRAAPPRDAESAEVPLGVERGERRLLPAPAAPRCPSLPPAPRQAVCSPGTLRQKGGRQGGVRGAACA